MVRDIKFRKMRLGSMADEGSIIVSPNGVIATETTPGMGDQITTITLHGGREVHVRGSHDSVRSAIAKAREDRGEDSAFQRACRRTGVPRLLRYCEVIASKSPMTEWQPIETAPKDDYAVGPIVLDGLAEVAPIRADGPPMDYAALLAKTKEGDEPTP